MNLSDVIGKISDIFLPPTHDEFRVRRTAVVPAHVENVHTRAGIVVLTLSRYESKDVRAVIKTLKYHGNQKSVRLCAQLLHDALVEELAEVVPRRGQLDAAWGFQGSSAPLAGF